MTTSNRASKHLMVTKEGDILPSPTMESPMPGVYVRHHALDKEPVPDPSIIYETNNGDNPRRVKVGSQVLTLEPNASVDVTVKPDGSGHVYLKIPASRIQVIPAGKRVVNQRERKRDREDQETKPDAD